MTTRALSMLAALLIFIAASLLQLPSVAAQGNDPTNTPIAESTATVSIEAGTLRTLPNGIRVVYVPAGCFLMGSDQNDEHAVNNEMPQHRVCVTKPYWLGQFEISNAEFQQFIDAGAYNTPEFWSNAGWTWKQQRIQPTAYPDYSSAPDQPRVGITWYEAEAFAKWAGGRLPTEAEWEYAARGSQSLTYPWGNDYELGYANVDETKLGGVLLQKTTPVGSYPDGRSWINAYDMVGNVWEWCADWYAEDYYQLKLETDPTGAAAGSSRSIRGSAWNYAAEGANAASRSGIIPENQFPNIGMRLAINATP
ncbi:MAG: formylglycine-generating enzyme family protein [Anaerolineae bacterium]|nr:formylglycine-generating enzyme family protein [Anaerolineae bacterium]